MKKHADRKRLKKLIGKEVTYRAIYSQTREGRTLLLNVTHRGKTVTDHMWISVVKTFEEGDQVRFLATAETYRDKHDNRKIGLEDVRMMILGHCDIESSAKNKAERAKRKKR